MTRSDGDGGGDRVNLNPAAVSTELRATPLPLSDDALVDDGGGRHIPATTREEQRAVRLGIAAEHAVLDDRLTEEVIGPFANHDGLEAALYAAELRRATHEQLFAAAAQQELDVQSVPNNTVPARRKAVSLVAKLLFMAGDTTAAAGLLYRSGIPLGLVVPMGCSLAATVVGAGSQLGREIALHNQRRDRGRPPDDCPVGVVDLFDDGGATERYRSWLVVGLLGALSLLVALTLVGTGLGDRPGLSFGFGLLAALTFAGSAATEGFAANAAAERLAAATKRTEEKAGLLTPFEAMERTAAGEGRRAHVVLAAATHAAKAAGGTAVATADRTPDNPHVFGYDDPGSVPVPAATAEPAPVPPEGPLAVIEGRQRRRAPIPVTVRLHAGATGEADDGDPGSMRSVS